MSSKVTNLFIIILIPVLLVGTIYPAESTDLEACSQTDCDMDSCDSQSPVCSSCPVLGLLVAYLPIRADEYLPPLTSSPMIFIASTLSDQEFVKSIFHPPTVSV